MSKSEDGPVPHGQAAPGLWGRILDRVRSMENPQSYSTCWAHYDFHHAVFQPRRMSPEALPAGHDWITREFYRPWRVARRLARCAARRRSWRFLPFAAAIDAAYYGRVVRWHIDGWNPAEREAVGELKQQGGADTGLGIGAAGGAMGEAEQHLERVLDDGARLLTLDVRHESDATGIMLGRRVVQPLGPALRHGASILTRRVS